MLTSRSTSRLLRRHDSRELAVELARLHRQAAGRLAPGRGQHRPGASELVRNQTVRDEDQRRCEPDINRFSSRRQRLDHAFLSPRLKAPRSYKRIAGYFRSSIFELVGEEIAGIPKVQIVCNSELDAADVAVSKHVTRDGAQGALERGTSEVEALLHRDRYRRLHDLLTSGRVEIRVVPKDRVFIHGKAGVIEAADGTKTCFLGSINETKSAFAKNYEILWEDHFGGGRRLGRGGVRRPLEGFLPASRRHRRGDQARRRTGRSPLRGREDRQSCPARRWPKAPSTAAASSFSRGSARS